MNYGNLKLLQESASMWLVWVGEKGVPMYCDGHLLTFAGDLKSGEHELGNGAKQRMIHGSRKMWAEAMQQDIKNQELKRGGIFGSMKARYHRELVGVKFTAFVQEPFVRCFDPTARFYSAGEEQKVLVYEGEKTMELKGIVMPIKCEPGEFPEVKVDLPDDVIYHVCEPLDSWE